jgi:methanogenic corrinoid protein MtbC1
MVHSEPWTVTKYRGDTVKSINRPLAAVVYRSHAVSTLSPPQLDALTLAAQARNRCESITGLMVYADNCFFQWLEGPVDSVDRIMRSIMNDPRHTDIEILNNQLIHQRSFADWSMKLALPAREFVPWRGGILSPSRTIVDELRRRPDTAPSILLKMVPVRAGDPIAESVLHDAANQMPLKRSTAALLKRVIVSTVIPELVRQHRRREASQPVMAAHLRTSELADLLVGSDQQAAFELIKELHQGAQRRLPLFGTLFEPAARRLGDLWSEDLCTEFDVTLGLSRLQTAVKLLAAEDEDAVPFDGSQPVVLIVPEPGELHRLGATLDSRVLSIAGWGPHVEVPANDKALQDIISASWFDVLDLSLSAAFRRDHWLPRVKETIRLARSASMNPMLMVLVGGRVFAEESGALVTTGADLASKTALNVDALILEKMHLLQGS